MGAATKWTAQEDFAVADMIARNLSYGSIARLTGRSQDAVRGRVRYLRESELLGDRARHWSDERDALLLQMTAAGSTRGTIARKLGVSHHAVTRRLALLTGAPGKMARGEDGFVERAQTGGSTEMVDRDATRQLERRFCKVAAKCGWAVRVQDAQGRWNLPREQVAA